MNLSDLINEIDPTRVRCCKCKKWGRIIGEPEAGLFICLKCQVEGKLNYKTYSDLIGAVYGQKTTNSRASPNYRRG